MKKINLLVSKLASKRLLGIAWGSSVLAIASAAILLPQKASAQALNPIQSPSNVTSQQSEKDPMYGQPGDFNVMNLIHRSQMGAGELTDPSKSISDATSRFLQQRQQMLNLPSQSGNVQPQLPQNPETNSQSSN